MSQETGLAVDINDGGIATITISQPERKNALTNRCGELARIADDLGGDSNLRCIVIRGGSGAGFGAGADIHEFVRERDGFEKGT